MKSGILNIYKPLGLSPLEAIRRFIGQNRAYQGLKMTYAGRLDPMAEGVLLVLVGETVHEKDRYLKVEKEYEAEILLGFETDTYDILGIPFKKKVANLPNEEIKKEIKKFRGEISLPLPPYSSYKIKGRPLFVWAREDKLNEIEIPIRQTEVYDIKFLKSYEVNSEDLSKTIGERIDKASGDFRQSETKNAWKKLLEINDLQSCYTIVKIRFTVSSGTYIRSIAHELGKRLGGGAILLSLIRTRVGEYEVRDSIKLP
ncbi:MAG: hypothetical protein COU71_00340 [Parcubacteria group bacterium CG10_big_fil_rev_8_21_14_0_10_38_31]|nr:MAG: hypothetical protein COU71_00340 [Parcubacteria group bacterium CG10_big_fil_rev_8_21_14_0_10_38_31]